jgi:osmotically-inducible protein OsmY
VLADLLAIRADDAPSSDHKITTHVREVLDWDLRLTGSLVDVRTTEQVVHLTGTVGTAADQARVIAIAYQAGATRVDARDLVVAYWALRREIRPEKFAPRADEDVAQAVRDTCGYDPRVLATSLQVRVREGVVLLFGTVSTLRAKHAAEQDARNVVGVSDVHNLLRVRPTESVPDAAIRQATEEALARDPYVGWVDFTVRVQQGSVQLGGLVDSIFEQQQAENIAAGVNGAVEVDNQIEAAGKAPYWATNPHSDKALAEHIRRLYFWSASLYDQEVAVQVANGRVTLSGTVVSAADRQQAAFDAYEAGAREVNNHLRITAAAMPHSRSETTLTEAPHSVCQ